MMESSLKEISHLLKYTLASVVYANLTNWYLEIKLFSKLPELFYDTVEFFLKKYFRFLDDVKYSWKENTTFHHYGN